MECVAQRKRLGQNKGTVSKKVPACRSRRRAGRAPCGGRTVERNGAPVPATTLRMNPEDVPLHEQSQTPRTTSCMCVPKDVCGDSCTSREYTEHTGLHTFSGRVVWGVRDNSVTLFCAGVSRMANGGWTASARKAEAQGWEVWAAKDLGALGGRPVSTGLGHPGFRALQKPSLTAARPTDAMTPLTQLCTRGIQGGPSSPLGLPCQLLWVAL